MSKNTNKNALTLIAILAVLLLASLIGNVITLSLLKSAQNSLSAVKTELTDAQYELAQYKTAEGSGTETPVEEPAPEVTDEPENTAEAPVESAEPSSDSATPKPTATPTQKPTPTPTPAGPYAGSNLAYEPLEGEKLTEVKQGIVACTVDVNVRSGPGTNYTKLASVSAGSQMEVSASAYGWFLVEYKNKTYGWISGQYFFGDWMFETGLNSYLTDVQPAKEYLEAPEKVTVTKENANARLGYNTTYEINAQYTAGDSGVCLAYENDWRLCNFKGTYSWIHKSNFQ